ncbi:hypothetical protein DBO86_15110 [Pseudomonas indoloxydans]|uniref:Uncharacterized protein n=1 Tax=Ectopseudomonas oleovorans TaxID=301 RepID=A0A2T5PKM2_ECTOL|nr:hypothetical protein DBO86_15110 [Pseudomonas indoloxydans]
MEKFRLLRDHLVDSGLSTDAELHRPEQSPAEALTLRPHRLLHDWRTVIREPAQKRSGKARRNGRRQIACTTEKNSTPGAT